MASELRENSKGELVPMFIQPPRPPCASRHHMPSQWKSGGIDNRGYELKVCKDCLRTIGYHQPKADKELKRHAERRANHDDD